MTGEVVTSKTINQTIYRVLTKKHGLKITAEASKYLIQVFQNAGIDLDNLKATLDYIVQQYILQYGILEAD